MVEMKSDKMLGKPGVDHDENVVVQQDLDMTAWQCLKANPKIVFWTLYANSELASHSLLSPNTHFEQSAQSWWDTKI